MIGMLKAMATTLRALGKKPVTVQYPGQHLPIQARYMGFPGLLWDFKNSESACTGCEVCMRYCPTECISVTMKDNPRFKTGESTKRKIVDDFQIRMERCILCGICVEVCNFDAIAMTHVHEEGAGTRGKLIFDMADLHRIGMEYQQMVLDKRQGNESNQIKFIKQAAEAKDEAGKEEKPD